MDMSRSKHIELSGHCFMGYGVLLPDLWVQPDVTSVSRRYSCLLEGCRKLNSNCLVSYLP